MFRKPHRRISQARPSGPINRRGTNSFFAHLATATTIDFMARVRQWLLIVLSLILGGQIIRAADSEDRAFSSASSTFSLNIWDQAEKQFADFVKQFPNSPRVAEAILYEGEAMYMQTNFFKAIELLSDHQNAAGKWSELYLYWTAQAELQHGDYPAAADAFGRLITLFPNSPNRLSACVGQAAALARAGEWERARHVLEKPDSVFQQVAKTNASEVAVQGRLLLGEAQLTGEDYPGLEGTLGVLSALNVNAELAWRREYLRCRLQIARDKLDDALQTATNLIALAGAASASQAEGRIVTPEARVGSAYGVVPPAAFWAEAMSLQAGIEERMNDLDKAITTYQQLIDNTNTPAAQLRHALFKTASLMESDDATNAMEKLQQFLNKFPNSPAADMALLTLGELKFKQYLAWSATNTSPTAVTGTNLLEDALDRFNHLSETFTNSPLVGKALLDKGWCLWSASSNNL